MKPMIATLEKLLDGPRDGAMLRFSLGNAWLDEDAAKAVIFFRKSLEFDPNYSAAWKGLGNALTQAGQLTEAFDAYQHGIDVAERRGDLQAAKEMKVFARRVEKNITG